LVIFQFHQTKSPKKKSFLAKDEFPSKILLTVNDTTLRNTITSTTN